MREADSVPRLPQEHQATKWEPLNPKKGRRRRVRVKGKVVGFY
jgi:hypothetical protein